MAPGNSENDACQWLSTQDGTCMRVFPSGAEQQWLGDVIQGSFTKERSVSFNGSILSAPETCCSSPSTRTAQWHYHTENSMITYPIISR